MKKVSVIIPVFNGEKHIKKCIDKVLNQTYANIEILVINDGSTDNTATILNKIQDDRVKVINKENSGVSEARNVGIVNVTGEFIIFLDSDDELEDNAIACLIDKIKQNEKNVEIILFGFKVFGTKNRNNDTLILKELKYIDNIKKELIKRMISITNNIYGYIWRTMYSRELLIKNNIQFPKGIKISEDYMFLLNAIYCADVIEIDDNEYYNYIINDSSMSIKYIPTLLEDMMFVNEWMYNKIVTKDSDLNDGYIDCVCNTYLRYVQTTVRKKNENIIKK